MGTRNMMQRQIVFVPLNFAREVGNMAAEHIIKDSGIRRGIGALRRTLNP
jgi:hypothetical protein